MHHVFRNSKRVAKLSSKGSISSLYTSQPQGSAEVLSSRRSLLSNPATMPPVVARASFSSTTITPLQVHDAAEKDMQKDLQKAMQEAPETHDTGVTETATPQNANEQEPASTEGTPDKETQSKPLSNKEWDVGYKGALYSPHKPLSEMFSTSRPQRDVILDFTTYILPYVMRVKNPYPLLGRYLKELAKNHPQCVLVIYDELDQSVKKKHFLNLAESVCNSLLKIGKPEIVQRLLKNRDDYLKATELVAIRIAMHARLGQYDESIQILDTFPYPHKSEKYHSYITLLEELVLGKQNGLVKKVYQKQRGDLFIPTRRLLSLIRLMIENGCVEEAQLISRQNTSRVLYSLEKGVITSEELQELEAKLQEAIKSNTATQS